MATKAKFRTKFNKGDYKFTTPTGEKTETRHRPIMHANGRRELVKDRVINLYENIQASREECEIERIIQRAVNGDYNALNAINGSFMDITDAPSSIAEAQQYIIDAKNEFEKLPKEIKAKFEYNPEIYIAEMSTNTESWLEKTGWSEKIKFDLEKAEAAAKSKETFDKAMSVIANGEVITQKGEDSHGNE